MKKWLVLFLLISVTLEARVREIRFNSENQDQFYLFNAQLGSRGVVIAQGDDVYKKVAGSFFIDFEHNLNLDSNISFFEDRVFGKQSGLFYESSNYLRFAFERQFEFGMVLEFWAKPFTVESGTLLSTEYLSTDGINRSLEVYFKSGQLIFSFHNLFIDESVPPKPRTVKISADERVPLKEWHHHRLVYNPANGKMDYYRDGKLLSQAWATKDGNPGSSIMYLETPKNWFYVLGKGYRGFLDNFFISADSKNSFNVTLHDENKGAIQSRVFHFDSLVSVYDMEISSHLPDLTALTLEYRVSSEPFADATSEEIIPWRDYNLVNRQYNEDIKGKYFQFRLQLYPSGEGQFSPQVSSLRMKYNTIDVPSIPLGLMASSSEGKIQLSFRESPSKNVVAYKIYYGTRSNEYWGNVSLQGNSPISVPITAFQKNEDLGRWYFTLEGLRPLEVYYFRIASLSDDGLESQMSEEVSLRVRKLK